MSQEAIELLKLIHAHLASIDQSMKSLVAQRRAEMPKQIASDRDLDGKYGNPTVKFMPRDWTGPSFKNRRMSDCPPTLLDMLAGTFDYFAEQAEKNDERTASGRTVAEFKRSDAARARGWAKRIREGRHIQQATDTARPAEEPAWADAESEPEWASQSDGGF